LLANLRSVTPDPKPTNGLHQFVPEKVNGTAMIRMQYHLEEKGEAYILLFQAGLHYGRFFPIPDCRTRTFQRGWALKGE